MRSYLSKLLLALVLLLNDAVEAHFQHPNAVSTPIHANSATKIGSKQEDLSSRDNGSSSLNGLSLMLRKGNGHRSLGGGIVAEASSGKHRRTLMQQQKWARDDEGSILWWVWLIISLSIALCCFVCCCSSACYLRD